jgi:hypothetical protein
MALFVPKPKIYRLHFEEHELSGLVVEVKPSSVGVLLDTADLASLAQHFKGISLNSLTNEDIEKIGKLRQLFDAFGDSLVSWNVGSDDDTPVPATREGVYSQDIDFIMTVITAWAEAVGGVSGPLENESNGGQPSPVAYLPMEKLTANQ